VSSLALGLSGLRRSGPNSTISAPACRPSDTFMEQLQLYYAAHCRVSTRDRTIRQYYMERNAAQVMSG
jgi:hypothetical protein